MEALSRLVSTRGVLRRSMETGTGRTTLLLSHLSADHTVFTKDDQGDGDSLRRVRDAPLLNERTVRFEIGPTQRTLLAHEFEAPLQLAYLDGPHAFPFPELEYWAVYPHIDEGGLLVVDDIHIPTLHNFFRFLDADAMWRLVEVVDHTAFFTRTAAPLVDPFGEGWWEQGYNRTPNFSHLPTPRRAIAAIKARTPQRAVGVLQRVRSRVDRKA